PKDSAEQDSTGVVGNARPVHSIPLVSTTSARPVHSIPLVSTTFGFYYLYYLY
ncbi:hypothetical protein Tco_0636444, partial [Tanacetum coccineum]